MKHISPLLTLVLLLALLSAMGCKKEKNENPLDQLPPETQTGANTFGCLVNGKPWKPGGTSPLGGPGLGAVYQKIYTTESGYVFGVSGSRKKSGVLENVGFNIDSVSIISGIKYQLIRSRRGSGTGQFTTFQTNPAGTFFKTNDSVIGVVLFTRFDLTNQIASGNFAFTAINERGDTVRVTNGRFDMRFTR